MFHFSASSVPLSIFFFYLNFNNNNNSATFIIFTTASGLAYLWATYIVPETANVSLEKIDSLFESSAWKEEAAVKYQVKFDIFFFSKPTFEIFFRIDRTGIEIGGFD